jgi:hypothetical protein
MKDYPDDRPANLGPRPLAAALPDFAHCIL